MKTIKLLELSIKNFKGIREKVLAFYTIVSVILGRNASGKTTLMDAFFWLLFGRTVKVEATSRSVLSMKTERWSIT